MGRPQSRRRGGFTHPYGLPLTSRTSDELPATTEKLYSNIPRLVWKARVRSGDLPSRRARRQHGARVRRVRGIRQLFGATHLA